MQRQKFWKGISSSYVVVTREANINEVRSWLDARSIIQTKALTVNILVEINKASRWQYINSKGKCFSVGRPRRGFHYYYATFSPDEAQQITEPRDKQLRLQRSMVEVHFRNLGMGIQRKRQ